MRGTWAIPRRCGPPDPYGHLIRYPMKQRIDLPNCQLSGMIGVCGWYFGRILVMKHPSKIALLTLPFVVTPWLACFGISGILVPAVVICSVGRIQAQPLNPDATAQFSRIFNTKDFPNRGDKLLEIINATSTIGDLNQILLFPDWQKQLLESEKILNANEAARKVLIDKLKRKYREILKGTDDDLKQAAAKQIGDSAGFGILTNASTSDRLLPRARMIRKVMADLQDDLMVLATKPSKTQHATLLALAKVESNPVQFAKMISGLLKTGPEGQSIVVRRYAAEALKVRAKMISLLLEASAFSQDEKLHEIRSEFLTTSTILIPVALEGLKDPDLLVREWSTASIQSVLDIFIDIDFMIPVRDAESLWRDLPDMLGERIAVIQEQMRQIEPIIKTLQKATLPLARHSNNAEADQTTRLECLDILEDCVVIRRKMWTIEYSIASALKKNPADTLANDPLPNGSNTNEVTLLVAQNLSDSNPAIRKAAAQVFEFIGGQPDWRIQEKSGIHRQTVEIVAKTAINDPNMLVRWICVRSLGQIALYPEISFPALMARIKSDDLEVRIAAVVALRSFGPKAGPLVSALGAEIGHGDADFRIAAMVTAESIGYACQPILQMIAENLLHESPKVRLQCANTLGQFGKAATGTLPALRRNLKDPDTETRLAVSNAILKIEQR